MKVSPAAALRAQSRRIQTVFSLKLPLCAPPRAMNTKQTELRTQERSQTPDQHQQITITKPTAGENLLNPPEMGLIRQNVNIYQRYFLELSRKKRGSRKLSKPPRCVTSARGAEPSLEQREHLRSVQSSHFCLDLKFLQPEAAGFHWFLVKSLLCAQTELRRVKTRTFRCICLKCAPAVTRSG